MKGTLLRIDTSCNPVEPLHECDLSLTLSRPRKLDDCFLERRSVMRHWVGAHQLPRQPWRAS